MKNILISALIAWLIHATGFIVDCTTLQYVVTLIGLSGSAYVLLEWIDFEIKQKKRRNARPVRRFTRINFDGTRI